MNALRQSADTWSEVPGLLDLLSQLPEKISLLIERVRKQEEGAYEEMLHVYTLLQKEISRLGRQWAAEVFKKNSQQKAASYMEMEITEDLSPETLRDIENTLYHIGRACGLYGVVKNWVQHHQAYASKLAWQKRKGDERRPGKREKRG